MLDILILHVVSFVIIGFVLKAILDWLGRRGIFTIDWNLPPRDDDSS